MASGNDIGWAVAQLLSGSKVTRPGWNGKHMWIGLSEINNADGTLVPFVLMRTAQRTMVPWTCSQTDLLATDWELA